jgi:hypothetical protein
VRRNLGNARNSAAASSGLTARLDSALLAWGLLAELAGGAERLANCVVLGCIIEGNGFFATRAWHGEAAPNFSEMLSEGLPALGAFNSDLAGWDHGEFRRTGRVLVQNQDAARSRCGTRSERSMQHRLVNPRFALECTKLRLFCLTALRLGQHGGDQTVELALSGTAGVGER